MPYDFTYMMYLKHKGTNRTNIHRFKQQMAANENGVGVMGEKEEAVKL